MNRHDLLLIGAGACLIASAALVGTALGLLVAGLVLAAAWYLLGGS